MLIDYVSHDRALLGIVAAQIAPVLIPLPVLGEVDGLDEAAATALGPTVYESTRAQLDEAVERPRSLSFEDYLCFLTARDLGITCVTNDEALLDHCCPSRHAAPGSVRSTDPDRWVRGGARPDRSP